MYKIAASAVLVVILVFPISVTIIPIADAKMQPSGRPDVSMTISISYVNEERFQPFYDDIGKVDRIFETVILPMINDFVKKHEKDLYERYTDEISIAYSRETNDVSIWFTQYPEGMGETIKISPQSLVTLEVVDMINVGFPVGYYSSIEYLLPNTSLRIGYLSNHMQELLEKYRDDIVKGHFHVISSFMLDDISKTTLYFDNRRISESETEIKLALDNPVSAYSVPEFSTNTPISIVKSSNHRLTVSCASPSDIAKMTLTLSYPSGEKVDMKPTLVERQGYKGIEFALQDDEPEGLYKFVLNDAELKNIVYCHARVNAGNDHPFEYVDRSTSSEPVLDRAWMAYRAESWCSYSRLMTVESPDAAMFDERTGSWITIYEWLKQFGEFESTWSNVHFDNTNPMYFLHAIKWRLSGSPDVLDKAINAFNSLEPDMKKGRELSLYLIRGDCINAEGREFLVETETTYVIQDLKFNQQDKKISYVIDTGDAKEGSFKVAIPKELLRGEFTLFADGKPHYVTESVTRGINDTHTWLGYSHEGPVTNIDVIGTEVIPEFPVNLMAITAIMLLGMVTALRIGRTTLIS